MKKYMIAAIATAATLGAAQSASAQYNDPYYGGGYNAPYGNAYGYNQRYGAERWARQLDQIRYQTDDASRSGRLDRRERAAMQRNIANVDYALRKYARNGLGNREAYDMDRRINALRQSLYRSANDRDGRRYSNRYDDNRRYDRDYQRSHEQWHDRHDD